MLSVRSSTKVRASALSPADATQRAVKVETLSSWSAQAIKAAIAKQNRCLDALATDEGRDPAAIRRRVLGDIDRFCVQSEETARRLGKLGADASRVIIQAEIFQTAK